MRWVLSSHLDELFVNVCLCVYIYIYELVLLKQLMVKKTYAHKHYVVKMHEFLKKIDDFIFHSPTVCPTVALSKH